MTDIFKIRDIVDIITEYTCDTHGVNKLLQKCHKHHLKTLKYPRCVYFDCHTQNVTSKKCYNCEKYMNKSIMTNEEIDEYDSSIIFVPFCLLPGTYQPSGHINLSRAREFIIT